MNLSKIGSFLAPLIGMTFFWRYFRFQSFFGVLYPLDLTYNFFGIPLPVSPIFLIVLLVLGLCCIPLRRFLETLLSSHRFIVLAGTAVGSLGVVLVFAFQQGDYESWIMWLSSLMISVGFIANYLAWALYFSSDFGLRQFFLLALSYFVSLFIFPVAGMLIDITSIVTLLTPLFSGLAWYFSPKKMDPGFDSKLSSLKTVGPYIYLFVIFLLAGSAIRGIVDTGGNDPTLRWGISLLIAAAVFAYWWQCSGRTKALVPPDIGHVGEKYQFVEQTVFKSWIFLVLLFFMGLFMGMAALSAELGGDIVVVARSLLDFFLWVLLCNLAFHKKASPIPLFIIYSLVVEVFSWCLSYVVVPALLNFDFGDDIPLQTYIVLIMVFVLISSVIIIFGFVILKRQSNDVAIMEKESSQGIEIPAEVIAEYKLTKRETEVMVLFAQGRSLRKTADLLFIATNTAQTHIKSAYRKLDIHSRDELTDLIDSWNS